MAQGKKGSGHPSGKVLVLQVEKRKKYLNIWVLNVINTLNLKIVYLIKLYNIKRQSYVPNITVRFK